MGWIFPPQQITNLHDPYDDRYYSRTAVVEDNLEHATWFQRSWWSHSCWRWTYQNDTSMTLKLNSITFNACAGNSKHLTYCGGKRETPDTMFTCYGYGCTFACDIYCIDSNENPVGRCVNFGTGTVNPITGDENYNCAAGGVPGTTSHSYGGTSFGDPALFSGDRAWHEVTIVYSNPDVACPEVPPGGYVMAVIRPISWTGGGARTCLLVMKGSSAYFSSKFIPVDKDYIYVCKQKEGDSSPKWYKEKKAFKRTDAGWEKMKGKA